MKVVNNRLEKGITMKLLRKLFTTLITMLMMVTMAGTAYASGEGSITVTNQKTDANGNVTYEVYRIFDVVAEDEYESLTYTINSNWSGFFTGTNDGAGYITADNDLSANGGKGYTPVVIEGEVKYIALTDSNVAAFGKSALDYSQKKGINSVASNNTGIFTGLDLGYYMVYPKGADLNVGNFTSIVSLTTTAPAAEVVQKAEYPTLEKTDDDDSVEVGQTVTYTLTSKVPDTTGFTKFDFTMHDQMTAGLTFDGQSSITVKIGTNVTVPASGDNAYTYQQEDPAEGYATAFKISIPVMKYQDYIGQTITVTYTAKVNDAAVTKIDKNHATLEYSNNPKDDTEKTTTPPDEEEVFSARIVIDKVDGTSDDAKLEGAKFILRCRSVADSGSAAKAEAGSYYKYTAATTDTPAKVEWVEAEAISTKVDANQALTETDVTDGITVVTTDTDGSAVFNGLENGVYELIEVKAPAGYNQVNGVAATVTVNGKKDNTASLTATQKVQNNAGSVLPSTGGIGTTIFYITGAVLVVGAGVMLVTRRKMSAEK
jgi:fimbrial isopeptide formation D2 family protein/LPXTG-motif cell wall-anchored protein